MPLKALRDPDYPPPLILSLDETHFATNHLAGPMDLLTRGLSQIENVTSKSFIVSL